MSTYTENVKTFFYLLFSYYHHQKKKTRAHYIHIWSQVLRDVCGKNK